MKWLAGILAGLGVVWALFSGFFASKWKGRANDALNDAEQHAIDALTAEGLRDKEAVLASLERTRGLSNDDRLRLALVRAKLRRSGDDSG